MNFAQRILKIFHEKDEAERMKLRKAIARATAEAEDVTRTVSLDGPRLQAWLKANCRTEQK